MEWCFKADMSDEVRGSIEPLLPEVEPLIPSWCERIFIFWDPDDADATLKFRANYTYRQGELWICPGFLSDCKPRLSILIHEVAGHCVNGPLQRFADDLIELLVDKTKDETLFKHLKTQMTERIESTSCDWEYGIQRLLMAKIDSGSQAQNNTKIAAMIKTKTIHRNKSTGRIISRPDRPSAETTEEIVSTGK